MSCAEALVSTVDLDREMRQVLIEMTLVSYGTTQSWDSSGGGGDGDGIPSGGGTLFDHWLSVYERQSSDRGRALVVESAQDALDQWRGTTAVHPIVATMSDGDLLRDRVLNEGKGWPAKVVADALRCTVTFVRKTRLLAGQDENGNTIEQALADADDLRSRVKALAGKNLSNRQIAMLAGTSARTVNRILRSPSDG